MDFNKQILDKIDSLINLSSIFDTGFKTVFNLETEVLNEENTDILYSMTKNYISIRKEHGEVILMFNKLMNSTSHDYNLFDNLAESSKKTKKSKEKDNSKFENFKLLYDISTFSTLINNINDLINNIDYEYKKIAVKYPKFINNKQIMIILITLSSSDNKFTEMIVELKKEYPEHKYKIIKCEDDKDILKCEEELKEYEIKIKSLKSLPLIYIVNGNTINEIPISKFDNIEPLKKLLS
jgi:hypothetical protein